MSIVLSQADLDYSGMKKIGRVTISERPDRVWIQVDGFEFDDLPTCRMQGARVIAWARDLLSAQLEAHRVAPGGNIGSCIGLLQEELEEEMKAKRRIKLRRCVLFPKPGHFGNSRAFHFHLWKQNIVFCICRISGSGPVS